MCGNDCWWFVHKWVLGQSFHACVKALALSKSWHALALDTLDKWPFCDEYQVLAVHTGMSLVTAHMPVRHPRLLHVAAKSGNVNIAADLANRHPDFPNALDLISREDCHTTPLGCAIRSENVDMVCLFLDLGSDPDATSNVDGLPELPLLYGAINLDTNAAAIVSLLLDFGADYSIVVPYQQGIPVYFLACMLPNPAVVERFLESYNFVHDVLFNGLTAVHLAAVTGQLAVLETLFRHGATVIGVVLHHTVRIGQECTIECLCAHGADPLQPDEEGHLPIDYARTESMRRLLRRCTREHLKKISLSGPNVV